MSYFGKLFLSGKKAAEAAEWIFTNRIKSLDDGRTVYTCMLNKNGGIEADLTVSRVETADGGSIPIIR